MFHSRLAKCSLLFSTSRRADWKNTSSRNKHKLYDYDVDSFVFAKQRNSYVDSFLAKHRGSTVIR